MKLKLMVVLLIVLAAGFVFASIYGSRNNSAAPLPPDQDGRIAWMKQHQPPAFIAGLIGRFSPKLVLPGNQTTITFTGIPIAISLPSATNTRFRTAKIRITSGCVDSSCSNVQINYESVGGEGSDMKLAKQAWTPSNQPDEASLVILSQGGTLTLKCQLAPSCVAQLE